MKILVIDDVDMHRKLTSKLLSKEKNVEVITANDAFEGFAILKAINDIELVILDNKMPYVDGAMFIQKIKDTDGLKEINVVMSSAESNDFDFKKIGADFSLPKPYTSDQLHAIIEQVS